jgi:LmbE family N-acetylglucosaminyl deacetylase
MAQAVQNGQRVVCVTATKGEKGVQDARRWPAEKLADIRAAELRAGLTTLGVTEHYWLGYPDGGCADVPAQEAVQQIKEYIEQFKPATILTFGPEGMTGHEDHRAVSEWVRESTQGTDIAVYHAVESEECYRELRAADEKFNFFFNIERPPVEKEDKCDLVLHLTPELLDQKYRCLCAMPSQTEAMFAQFGRQQICKMICCEAFVKA